MHFLFVCWQINAVSCYRCDRMAFPHYFPPPLVKGSNLELSQDEVKDLITKLQKKGGWLDDESCLGRLVYVDGRFVPQLSITNDVAQNLGSVDSASEEVTTYLARLTDGFTDELAAPVVINDEGGTWTSFKKMSGPDHCIGAATSQFAINTQQGTACFAALNTIRTGAVAYIHAAPNQGSNDSDEKPKPVLIVNAATNSGSANAGEDSEKGVSFHPRTLVVAEKGSRLSVVQSCVDLENDGEHYRPKLYNGYTQFFIKENSNVTHSYLEESGGIVTGGVEQSGDDLMEGATDPREVESQRPALKDTHLEIIDVHLMGQGGGYQGTMMGLGGSGRVRTSMSVTLLSPETTAIVNGFSLSGGAQRTDMKTNIHHIADGTVSRQMQKNMIGGRATGSFRGRIRVEQSAQQTDSQQLSRTILLSDRSRAWAVPSLEIVADDVTCTHGATVSDLSEEELFYLRSRGLSTSMARNLLMYAFAGDISSCVDSAMLGSVDSAEGLQKRIIQRLENLVPRGERAIKGEFQSV
jgi:Fe-S cluster assembly scaffold protein SufB